MLVLIWIQLFDTLMVFLKEFLGKVNFEKSQQTTKNHEKLPSLRMYRPQGYKTFHTQLS